MSSTAEADRDQTIREGGVILDIDQTSPNVARQRAPTDPKDFYFPIRHPIKTETGQTLSDKHIRVRRYGRRNGPPVLIMGGISAGRHLSGASGWWNDIVTEGGAIDLTRYAALGLDFAPLTDEHIHLSPRTQAQLILQAMDELGIDKLNAIVGASYGGMVALALGALAPERVGALLIISAAHQPAPLASAWRGVQRRMVEFALEQGCPSEGLALARQLAMITYRSADEFAERFNNIMGQDGKSDLDRYLISRGQAYHTTMSPKRWLSLSEAIDRANVTPEAIKVPTTLVACPTDQIVPFPLVAELAKRLPNFTALHALPSLYGHDAFLKEPERLTGIIRSFLRTIPQ